MEKSNVIIQMRTTPVSCLSSIMVSGLKTALSAPRTTTGVQLVSLFQSSNTKSKNAEELNLSCLICPKYMCHDTLHLYRCKGVLTIYKNLWSGDWYRAGQHQILNYRASPMWNVCLVCAWESCNVIAHMRKHKASFTFWQGEAPAGMTTTLALCQSHYSFVAPLGITDFIPGPLSLIQHYFLSPIWIPIL